MSYTCNFRTRSRKITLALLAGAALFSAQGEAIAGSGGVDVSSPTAGTTVPGTKAKLKGGLAIPPADAPPQVVRAIEAANRIESMPYEYGGGHRTWLDDGYDCSGTVSFALGKYGAKVITAPMPSTGFMGWEEPGSGEWITTYSKPSHMYVVIAGLRFDTSQTPGNGPGWSKRKLVQPGYDVRHPAGL